MSQQGEPVLYRKKRVPCLLRFRERQGARIFVWNRAATQSLTLWCGRDTGLPPGELPVQDAPHLTGEHFRQLQSVPPGPGKAQY